MPDVSVRDITAKLEQGVKDLFESDKYAAYLQTMSRFHHYSTRNTLLIHMQYPSATNVATYLSWKNNFNRQVKKGERAIKIFAPVPRSETKEFEKLDPVTKKPVLDENGQPVMEKLTSLGGIGFKSVNVFAYEQTDGEPLPTLAETLTGAVERYELFMDALRAVSPLPIVFEDMPPDTDGVCHFGDRITIRNGMSELQTVCAAVHEIAHSLHHDRSHAIDGAEPKSRRVIETESEAISFVVLSRYNLDTGANSFGYIAEYASSRELKELTASLDTIHKASAELIESIDKQYQALAKERGIDLSVVTDELGAEQNYNMVDGIVNNEALKDDESPATPETPSVEQDLLPDKKETHTEPSMNNGKADILTPYARNTEVRDPRQEGSTILMPLLYEDGNLNRETKRSRVKVEPPIGKYEIFSRDAGAAPYAANYLYCMSASGYLIQLGESERLKDLTEQKIDKYVLDTAAAFERQLSNPSEWADFSAAALLNRIGEAETHNVPVRELREAERQAEREVQIERDRRLAAEKRDIFNARVDEIAKAIETGGKIQVAYDAGAHDGKNPVLELFKMYDVHIPLRTQSWVNKRLAAITSESYSFYKKNGGKASSAFMDCLHKLIAEIKRMPIEQKRGVHAAEKSTENTEVKYTLEHELYNKFAGMFPEFMNGEYETLRLESEYAKPLELKWVFGDTVSIAHIYELDGEPAYEPRVMLKVSGKEKTMTAVSIEVSEPPRLDNVFDDRGNANAKRQHSINSFTSQWLDKIATQRFRPVEATYDVDERGNISKAGLITDKIVRVTFDADGIAIRSKPESKTQASDERAANELYAKYCDVVAEKAAAFAVSSGTLLNDDEAAAHKSCDQIVSRIVNGLLLESFDHYNLYEQYTENEDFKGRLEDYAFTKAWLEPKSAERAAKESDKTNNAAERGLYDKFAALFPDFAEGKYSYMRLESDGFEPLTLERTGESRVMVMHSYTLNGDFCYDPMMEFEFDTEAKTMSPISFEQSVPPLYQYFDHHRFGKSVDGSGKESTITDLQARLDSFASDWLGNIAEQGFIPINAHLVMENEEISVTFDVDGNMIMPEPDKDAIKDAANPLFPDPTVTPVERDDYGYTEPDMHPLNQEKALELFDAGRTVYLLYPDNTEAMAFDRDEIITFTEDGGFCGITHADWQLSGEFKTQAILSGFREDATESDLLFGNENKFGIYQIPGYIEDYRDFRFASMSDLEARELAPDRGNYTLVYTGNLDVRDKLTNLNKIYQDFNISHPDDYKGRSVSVSDVIVLQWRGEVSSHFVDSFGFKELPSFTGNERDNVSEQALSRSETRPEQKRAEPQKPAKKEPQTLLGELAEAKETVAKGAQQNARKPNEREV